MIKENNNCRHCPERLKKNCDGREENCMCRECPRNLGKCIVTKYCTETESIISLD